MPTTDTLCWAAVMLMQHPGKIHKTPDDLFPGHCLALNEEQDLLWKIIIHLFIHAFLQFAYWMNKLVIKTYINILFNSTKV